MSVEDAAKRPRITPTDATGSHFDGSGGILSPKPRLNVLETRYRDILLRRGIIPWEQAITLALDPPFRSYRPDLAYEDNGLVFVEVKGPHRFREKGIAKAALAAKTYPTFLFELVEWDNTSGWKHTTLGGNTRVNGKDQRELRKEKV